MKILWVIHVASQAQLFPKSSLPGNLSQHLLKKTLVFLDLKEKTDLTYYIHRHTFLSQTRTNHFLDSKMLVFFVVDFILIFIVQLECSDITKSNRGYIISPMSTSTNIWQAIIYHLFQRMLLVWLRYIEVWLYIHLQNIFYNGNL